MSRGWRRDFRRPRAGAAELTPKTSAPALPEGSGVGERSRSMRAYPRPRRDFRRPRAGDAELTPKTMAQHEPEAPGSANARGALGRILARDATFAAPEPVQLS